MTPGTDANLFASLLSHHQQAEMLYRYLIQRKQNGTDGSTFTLEAGANAIDELESKGGIEMYIEQVSTLKIQALRLHVCR